MEPKYPEITVQLTGVDGNAMNIIAAVCVALRRAGLNHSIIEEFTVEAMSGDYNNVLRTCMAWVDVK